MRRNVDADTNSVALHLDGMLESTEAHWRSTSAALQPGPPPTLAEFRHGRR